LLTCPLAKCHPPGLDSAARPGTTNPLQLLLIKCQSVDHPNKGAFKPITKAPGQWAFACSFRGLGILGPFTGPVTVDVMHGLAVDRVGAISLCA